MSNIHLIATDKPRRVCKNAFINGAKSDAAKAYWYNIFKQNL